jgi:hypothetical protein
MKQIMEQRKDNTLLIVLVGICLLIIGGSIGFMMSSQDRGNYEKQLKLPSIIVINNTSVPVTNDTAVLNQISELKSILDEDDIWKAKAITLAEDEWNTERHLYNALISLNVTDIDDKSDITNVIIRDTETSSVDVDDKDADVSQEVRVYYENSVGDDKRITLNIDTEIVEGEVEDVNYELA